LQSAKDLAFCASGRLPSSEVVSWHSFVAGGGDTEQDGPQAHTLTLWRLHALTPSRASESNEPALER
jgi:hypothetical protein